MELIQEYRQNNKLYQITFPTGDIIPFRILTWKDFSIYLELGSKNSISADILEDAIFSECVLDRSYIRRAPDMPAGIVSTVVAVIMSLSGPSFDPESFNTQLENERSQVDSIQSQIIMLICRAFPGYIPEQVMDMSWNIVKQRLVQAERILLSTGALVEPIKLLTLEEAEKLQKKQSGKVSVEELIKDGKQMKSFDRTNPAITHIDQVRPQPADLAQRQHDMGYYKNLTPQQYAALQNQKKVSGPRRGM